MRRQRWGRTNNISPRWLACSVGDNKRGVRLGTVVHNPHAAGGGIGVCGTHFVRATMHRMVTRRCFHQRWVSGRPHFHTAATQNARKNELPCTSRSSVAVAGV